MPGLSALQRQFVSYALDGKRFVHRIDAGPARGIAFSVQLPEDKGIWTGTYEVEFATRLAAAIRPGAVTYDIGSWHGFFAGVMAAQGTSEVHVFEPLPENAERVRELIALNSSKSIKLHVCAIADEDREMDLLVMAQSSMAKLELSPFQTDQPSASKVRVLVRSIDSIVAAGEAPPPDLIKIDVEGAEVLVLQGAIDTLRNHHPQIFAEIHSYALLAQCERLLHGEGFTTEHIDEDPAAARVRGVFQIRACVANAR